MRVADQQLFLKTVDEALAPLGFNRPARSQEWSKVSESDRMWVHLNFGLGLIIPTIGVEYVDLRKRWPDLPGAVYGTMVVLAGLGEPARPYVPEDGPSCIVSDLLSVGIPAFADLQNRERVIKALHLQKAGGWPAPSYSHRIRLAPLMLCGCGRVQDALRVGDEFTEEATVRDQILPPYSDFLAALRLAVAG